MSCNLDLRVLLGLTVVGGLSQTDCCSAGPVCRKDPTGDRGGLQRFAGSDQTVRGGSGGGNPERGSTSSLAGVGCVAPSAGPDRRTEAGSQSGPPGGTWTVTIYCCRAR